MIIKKLCLVVLFLVGCNTYDDGAIAEADQIVREFQDDNEPKRPEEKLTQIEIEAAQKSLEQEQLKQKSLSVDPETRSKLSTEAQKRWPEDYSTQEYWINEEISAYHRMKKIPNDPIKKRAQRQWPVDYSVQEHWYKEQVAAKKRLQVTSN